MDADSTNPLQAIDPQGLGKTSTCNGKDVTYSTETRC